MAIDTFLKFINDKTEGTWIPAGTGYDSLSASSEFVSSTKSELSRIFVTNMSAMSMKGDTISGYDFSYIGSGENNKIKLSTLMCLLFSQKYIANENVASTAIPNFMSTVTGDAQANAMADMIKLKQIYFMVNPTIFDPSMLNSKFFGIEYFHVSCVLKYKIFEGDGSEKTANIDFLVSPNRYFHSNKKAEEGFHLDPELGGRVVARFDIKSLIGTPTIKTSGGADVNLMEDISLNGIEFNIESVSSIHTSKNMSYDDSNNIITEGSFYKIDTQNNGIPSVIQNMIPWYEKTSGLTYTNLNNVIKDNNFKINEINIKIESAKVVESGGLVKVINDTANYGEEFQGINVIGQPFTSSSFAIDVRLNFTGTEISAMGINKIIINKPTKDSTYQRVVQTSGGGTETVICPLRSPGYTYQVYCTADKKISLHPTTYSKPGLSFLAEDDSGTYLAGEKESQHYVDYAGVTHGIKLSEIIIEDPEFKLSFFKGETEIFSIPIILTDSGGNSMPNRVNSLKAFMNFDALTGLNKMKTLTQEERDAIDVGDIYNTLASWGANYVSKDSSVRYINAFSTTSPVGMLLYKKDGTKEFTGYNTVAQLKTTYPALEFAQQTRFFNMNFLRRIIVEACANCFDGTGDSTTQQALNILAVRLGESVEFFNGKTSDEMRSYVNALYKGYGCVNEANLLAPLMSSLTAELVYKIDVGDLDFTQDIFILNVVDTNFGSVQYDNTSFCEKFYSFKTITPSSPPDDKVRVKTYDLYDKFTDTYSGRQRVNEVYSAQFMLLETANKQNRFVMYSCDKDIIGNGNIAKLIKFISAITQNRKDSDSPLRQNFSGFRTDNFAIKIPGSRNGDYFLLNDISSLSKYDNSLFEVCSFRNDMLITACEYNPTFINIDIPSDENRNLYELSVGENSLVVGRFPEDDMVAHINYLDFKGDGFAAGDETLDPYIKTHLEPMYGNIVYRSLFTKRALSMLKDLKNEINASLEDNSIVLTGGLL